MAPRGFFGPEGERPGENSPGIPTGRRERNWGFRFGRQLEGRPPIGFLTRRFGVSKNKETFGPPGNFPPPKNWKMFSGKPQRPLGKNAWGPWLNPKKFCQIWPMATWVGKGERKRQPRGLIQPWPFGGLAKWTPFCPKGFRRRNFNRRGD